MDKQMVAPDVWIAVLRIVVGAWFFKAVWTKLAWAFAGGVIPYPVVSARFVGFHPKRVAEFANGNPIEWYKNFLETTVLPNAHLFATLQAYGEAAVGLGLRSEEHTSELQSPCNLVCRLLLEKKKKKR